MVTLTVTGPLRAGYVEGNDGDPYHPHYHTLTHPLCRHTSGLGSVTQASAALHRRLGEILDHRRLGTHRPSLLVSYRGTLGGMQVIKHT